MPIREVLPLDVQAGLATGAPPALLDVRREDEWQFCHLKGALWIPLHELAARQDELEALRGREVVVYCHHGVRSLHGAAYLESLGIAASSMRGGIELWSVTVDPKVPRY